jgi:hypothetical protein
MMPMGEPALWHVFHSDGRLLCTAPVLEDPRIEQVTAGRAYIVTRDEDDVPQVVVYSVEIPE